MARAGVSKENHGVNSESLYQKWLISPEAAKSVGKTLAGYTRGRPLPVLPKIRPRLPRGTQQVPHDRETDQTSTSTRTVEVTCGGVPSQ